VFQDGTARIVVTRFLEARCSHEAKRATLPGHSKL
jgi:hypothetical protein